MVCPDKFGPRQNQSGQTIFVDKNGPAGLFMTTISVRPDRQIWSEVDKNGPGGQILTSMKPTQGNMLRTLVMDLSFF